MRKYVIRIPLGAMLFALSVSAEAQEAARVWRIGVLVSSSASLNASRDEALRQGLREMGYVEGKNIVTEYRYAEGKLDRLSELAPDLVRSKPDVIVAGGTRVAVAAKQATSTIPIIVAGAGDLVAAGLVHNLNQPGGNVTGVSRLSPEILGTRVELLKETLPKATRIATLVNPENPGNAASLREIELDSLAQGMRLQLVTARNPDDLPSAFRAATKESANALLILVDAFFSSYRSRVVELAAKHRLPALYDRADFVEVGGLMSYGMNLADLSRRAAWYIDKVLKGANPANLPLTEPMNFELVINLKTAKQIGLTIPPQVLARADKVIK
ncbi:MAG TPA: ABC transporter substrate-binding protein [Candidatus Binatia bacterium]|nr:ABC transporter substrate-binding protein [Candidatus Binatia bacterium]